VATKELGRVSALATVVLDSELSLIHSAKQDRPEVDVPEPVADVLARSRQRPEKLAPGEIFAAALHDAALAGCRLVLEGIS